MSKKLLFIMNDSEAFIHDEVVKTYKKWGFTPSTVRTVDTWNPALVRGAMSLFGDLSMVHLDLSDKNKLKGFVSLIRGKETKSMFEKENWFGPGLIITSTHAQGTKAIETLVKNSGGKVMKKEKPEVMKRKMLARMNLNDDTKAFIDSYAGEDYNMLISVANEIDKLNKEEQYQLTPEELAFRLPGKPGTVPPWEFINPMLEGNTDEAIQLFERSMTGSHVLVSMLLARKKLQLLYRLKCLQLAGIRNSKEQAQILGERNGPNIWITAKVAQRLDLKTTEFLALWALETEANLKGELNVDPILHFKVFIAATSLSIRYNQVMPLDI